MKKKPAPLTVKLTASLAALAALGSGLANQVDPVSCLVRGGAAFFLARFLAGLWCALFPAPSVENSGVPEPETLTVELAQLDEDVQEAA